MQKPKENKVQIVTVNKFKLQNLIMKKLDIFRPGLILTLKFKIKVFRKTEQMNLVPNYTTEED